MLFWIFIIAFIIGIVLTYLGRCDLTYDVRHKYPVLEWLYHNDGILGAIIAVISAICIVISLFCIIGNHITADAFVAVNEEKYEALCYKLESDYTKDEFGLLNKEIIDEIQEWNKDLAFYKEVQDDFWLGIYYPNVYDQFEKIELK